MKSRSAFVSGVLFIPLALSGCTSGDAAPTQQFDEVIAHVREGKLTSAYNAWLPPSYGRGIDDVLSKLGQLVDEDDYETLRQALSSGGTKLAGFMAFTGADDPVIKLVVEKLGQIPKVLGIDTYERFRELNAASLLGALEEGIFRELMEIESVRQNVSSVSFELKERQRDWARLAVRFQPPDGDAAIDRLDVIRVEGRWVPVGWVTDWSAIVDGWRDQIEAALKLKAEAPAAFKKSLAVIREVAESPTALLKTWPGLARQFGLVKTDPE